MKNNKGYYSWIHSLNRAGLQAQRNGFNMLNEAKKAGRPSSAPSDDSDLQYDPTIHAQIAAEKKASGEELSNERRRAAMQLRAKPINLDPNKFDGPDVGIQGDANEVAQGQKQAESDFEDTDWAQEMADAAAIRDAAERNAAERSAQQYEEEEEEHNAAEEARLWSGYSGRTGEVHESIFDKIARMLKG